MTVPVRILKWIATGAALLALLALGREFGHRLPEFAAWVKALGVWGPIAFILAYGLAAVLLVPGVLLTVAAGAIWGIGAGTLYVMLGATLGAVLAFFSARHFVRRFVEQYVARHPRLAAIDRAVEAEGVRLVLLLRLSPVVSYVLLNYVLGVSRVRFRDYFAGTIGMLPAVMMYVYAGRIAGDLASFARGTGVPRGPVSYAILALGLIATILASVLLARAASRAISRQTPDQQSHSDVPTERSEAHRTK